jgi:type II secretory pathway pseudopilin PulG
MLRRDRRRALTFAEVLVAMVFVGIVLPVTLGAILLANRTATMAARKRQAVLLADRVLHEAIGTGSAISGDDSGDFGDHHPGYTWSLTSARWDTAPLDVITVTVSYSVQGTVYTESLSTLVDPAAVTP